MALTPEPVSERMTAASLSYRVDAPTDLYETLLCAKNKRPCVFQGNANARRQGGRTDVESPAPPPPTETIETRPETPASHISYSPPKVRALDGLDFPIWQERWLSSVAEASATTQPHRIKGRPPRSSVAWVAGLWHRRVRHVGSEACDLRVGPGPERLATQRKSSVTAEGPQVSTDLLLSAE